MFSRITHGLPRMKVFLHRRILPPVIARPFSSSKYLQLDKALTEEDVTHLQDKSTAIMEDAVVDVLPQDVGQYLLPVPQCPTDLLGKIRFRLEKNYVRRHNASLDLMDLCLERLENQPLKDVFHIDEGFNHHCYFMFLHVWLIHRRLLVEGKEAHKLEDMFFDNIWAIIQNWMLIKKIPEYRFFAELRNVQEFMLGMCVALDQAIERADVLPARMQYVIWGNMYSGKVPHDAPNVILLTKYMIRQLSFLLQVPKENVLSANFVWADMPVLENALVVRSPEYDYYLPKWRESIGDYRRGGDKQRPFPK